MWTILNALVPVFAVIALGATLKRIGFPGDALWQPLERLTYFVLFPPLLFYTLVNADMSGPEVGRLALVFLAAVVAMAILLGLTRPLMGLTGPQYSSVFQGAIRWNGFVALGIVNALYGLPGVALAAVAFATMVPTVNVMSVLVLSRHASHHPARFLTVARAVVTNPLILACLAGIAVQFSGIELPLPVLGTLKVLSDATISLGLLAVGAALDFHAAKRSFVAVSIATTLRLIVMPAIMLGACFLLGVSGLPRDVALICGAVPGATSAYILARQLGGDATLMATLITVSTLISAVTLPLIIFWFGS